MNIDVPSNGKHIQHLGDDGLMQHLGDAGVSESSMASVNLS